jgi:predicted alpha/beta-fold hydrolase
MPPSWQRVTEKQSDKVEGNGCFFALLLCLFVTLFLFFTLAGHFKNRKRLTIRTNGRTRIMTSTFLWTAVIILALLVIFMQIRFFLYPFTYFAKTDMSQILAKELQIPVGDIELHACYYLPKYALDSNNQPVKARLPLIFLNPGWGQKIDSMFLKQWAVYLALAGPYAVLTYDYRGLGKSPGKKLMTPKILEDIPRVFDFGAKLPEIDPGKMGFIGFSFGAVVALTKAYSDERIKAIVSIVGLSNCKKNFSRKPKDLKETMGLKMLDLAGVKPEILSDEDNRLMSPEFVLKPDRPDLNHRVFLMNSTTDECIVFDSFTKNQNILKLPQEQILVTKKGGHAGFHQELILASRMAQFFHTRLG